MNNLPQQQETFSLLPKNFAEAEKLAQYMANSDLVPKDYYKKPANVLIAVQMGYEVGLQPMQSIQNIAVINGRPCLWGDAMLALCKAHPDFESIEETFDEEEMKAICKIKRKGHSLYTATFSRKDAECAGLWGKKSKTGFPSPWVTYPKRMLQLRARGFGLRDTFPDALKGLNSAEEVRDYETKEQPIKNMGSADVIVNKVNEKNPEAVDPAKTNDAPAMKPPGVVAENPLKVSIDDIKKAIAKHDVDIDKFFDHYEISRYEELEGKFDLGKILAQITSKPLRPLPQVIQTEEITPSLNKARDDEGRSDHNL